MIWSSLVSCAASILAVGCLGECAASDEDDGDPDTDAGVYAGEKEVFKDENKIWMTPGGRETLSL